MSYQEIRGRWTDLSDLSLLSHIHILTKIRSTTQEIGRYFCTQNLWLPSGTVFVQSSLKSHSFCPCSKLLFLTPYDSHQYEHWISSCSIKVDGLAVSSKEWSLEYVNMMEAWQHKVQQTPQKIPKNLHVKQRGSAKSQNEAGNLRT